MLTKRHWITLLLTSFVTLSSWSQVSIDGYLYNKTVTHEQAILKYIQLEKEHPKHAKLITYGRTDVGKPLHLFVINPDGEFDPAKVRESNKSVVLVNNAIHPGEPCGVDASILMAKEYLEDKDLAKRLENTVICIIPMYNIGGALNRNCCSRANQNGPESYGFRGNARNLDLNRDFIKADSRNAMVFMDIYQDWYPDVFVDTHTSNGADYQHVMTLIVSQTDKMGGELGRYTKEEFSPYLYDYMGKQDYPMVPYVHTVKSIPDSGIYDYLETPRYSTGYATLFNSISFVSETHMLKTFEDRVISTRHFLDGLIEFTVENGEAIRELRKTSNEKVKKQNYFALDWELDTTRFDMIPFKGYEAKQKYSKVTGMKRLYYDRESPWERDIKYYNRYTTTDSVKRPLYYIVPQAWGEVVERMQQNGIKMFRLTKDTTIMVENYYIDDYETVSNPYEGHYLHYNVETTMLRDYVKYHKGDYVIPVNQIRNRAIVETLEPRARDSYFAWNFFDEILQQKEWFSAYVFEDEAAELLENDRELKADFDKKKADDPEFRKSDRAQLYFIYKRSPNYERTHNRYPISRMMSKIDDEALIPAQDFSYSK